MFLEAIGLGAFSALGVFIILLRLPRMMILYVLGYAWALDIFFSALLFAMHWGTAIGGFSAVIGGLFCSLGITLAKGCLGYIKVIMKRSITDSYFPEAAYYKGWLGDTRPVNKRNTTVKIDEAPV